MDIDKAAERAGLKDTPIQLEFPNKWEDWEVDFFCPRCGLQQTYNGSGEAGYDHEDAIRASHDAWECDRPSLDYRWWRFKQHSLDKVAKLVRRKRTPWGWKHKTWRPNVYRGEHGNEEETLT